MTPDAEASPIPPDGGEGRARARVDEHLRAEVADLDAVNATLRTAVPVGAQDAGALSERLESAFENAAIGMGLLDLDGRWLQVNQALCEITGPGHGQAPGHLPRCDHARGRRGHRPRAAAPAHVPRDPELPDREAPQRRQAGDLGAGDVLARARRRGDPAARDPPGPGHLGAEGAQRPARLPDGPRPADRPVQPPPLRPGAHAAGGARGALRIRRRRADDGPRSLQAGQRQLRPQGGRRPAQGHRRRAAPSRPQDRCAGAPERRRVRAPPAPGRPGGGLRGRRGAGQGRAAARGDARGEDHPHDGQRGRRPVRRPELRRAAGLRRPGDVRGQGIRARPHVGLPPRRGPPPPHGAARRGRAPAQGARRGPAGAARAADPRPRARARSPSTSSWCACGTTPPASS